jgi:tRNA nucleotidyltransferase (CCA-adding enzyme)
VMKLVEGIDALRRPEGLEPFLQAVEADYRGRKDFAERPYPQADAVRVAVRAASAVSPQPFLDRGLQGPKLGSALRRARVAAIAASRQPHAPEG